MGMMHGDGGMLILRTVRYGIWFVGSAWCVWCTVLVCLVVVGWAGWLALVVSAERGGWRGVDVVECCVCVYIALLVFV